jgi:hypothetical protein
VLFGAAQFAIVAIVLNAVRHRTADPRPVTATEFDELLGATA